MKVILMPVETAGYVSSLEKGLSDLGVLARAVLIEKHPAQYKQLASNPGWATWVANLTHLKNERGKAIAPLIYFLGLVIRTIGCFWVASNCSHIILNNGRSLLPLQLDLLLYRFVGIKIIAMMGHGSEIRPACIDSLGDAVKFSTSEIRRIHGDCRKRKTFARRVERLSHIVISTPTISHYLKGTYLNGHLLGIPVSMPGGTNDFSEMSIKSPFGRKIRVVHIPSSPEAKGTKTITTLCLALESEGLIQFCTASRVTHRETIRLLSNSDLLLDQVYSDVYMPVLATEAAFLGKPSIVAGYAWDYLDESSSIKSRPPVINVLPQDLESKLRSLISNPRELQDIGKGAKKFALTERTPDIIAKKYIRLLSNDENYIKEVSVSSGPPYYLWGCGSSIDAVRSLAQSSKQEHRCFQ